MRQEYSTTIEFHENILILDTIKILKEHITEKYKEGRSKSTRNKSTRKKGIARIAQQIRENVDNGGKT